MALKETGAGFSMSNVQSSPVIAAVLPCFRVTEHILEVLEGIGDECQRIYVVDDFCPDNSGKFVEEHCSDPRVKVIYNEKNLGVGGAVMAGYAQAIEDGVSIIVKVDGDGQMDPALIPLFVAPIVAGRADYTKGNRFFYLEQIHRMPKIRLFGNAVLSFLTKLSSGYWDLFDPTNGYTAVHADVARRLPFDKISRSYFFETDMLFRLNTLRAVVVDIPMDAKYEDETSHLKISRIVTEFLTKHIRNFSKRIFYNYYLRDLSIASLELPLGILLFIGGAVLGVWSWGLAASTGVSSTAGTVMLSAMPILMGLQLILAFLSYDISSIPKRPLQTMVSNKDAVKNDIQAE